jgi:hypothetical protein
MDRLAFFRSFGAVICAVESHDPLFDDDDDDVDADVNRMPGKC